MIAHNAGCQHIEQGLRLRDRIARTAIAGAQGEPVAGLIDRAEFPHIDIVPAEAGAVIGAERDALKQRCNRVADRVYSGIFDMLEIRAQCQLRCRIDRNAHAPGGWHVKAALFCKQPGIAVECGGPDFRLVESAHAEIVTKGAEIADAEARAKGPVLAPVAEGPRAL